jgi:hypothetical protein
MWIGSGSFAKTYKAYKDKDKSYIYACKVNHQIDNLGNLIFQNFRY